MYAAFSCFSLVWVGLLIACPVLIGFALTYILDRQTRRLGFFMVIAGVIGSLTFAVPCYLLFWWVGRQHPFAELPLSSWWIVVAGGFAFGSLPVWIWRRHV